MLFAKILTEEMATAYGETLRRRWPGTEVQPADIPGQGADIHRLQGRIEGLSRHAALASNAKGCFPAYPLQRRVQKFAL